MADKFNEQLTRERNAVEQVGVIKNAIKSVAENKSIEVLDTDTPISVLEKIDDFDGGDYDIESVYLEDGTRELVITDAVKTTGGRVKQRSEPSTWKRIRETLHTDPNDQFFLIASGASDTISVNELYGTVSIYGGEDGTTLLFSHTTTGTENWYMNTSDLENYPLPQGLHFSDLQGCYYKDAIVGECELFAMVIHRSDGGINSNRLEMSTAGAANTRFEYRVLEYAGNSAPEFLLCARNGYGYCRSCEFIFLGEAVTTIGRYAFQNCSSLTNITIPDGVTSIGDYAFNYCYSLTNISIPDSVTNIGDYAFNGCYSLTNINIPDSVTSIGYSAFSYCTSLTNIHIPDSVISIDTHTFSYCYSLTNIHIPDGVTSIGAHAFYSCYSLTNIHIPDSITSIGGYAFYYCSSLTTITIPDGVTSIGSSAFNGCYNLTHITIPDGVTSIDSGAFSSCYNLTHITIPDSVTSISNSAFSYCYTLKYLQSNCVATSSYLSCDSDTALQYINMPYTQLRQLIMYGQSSRIMRIGSFGEVEGSESPTLGLKTPILVDYTNSLFDGSTTPVQLQYACLTLDHLKSIFDWLPVTTTARTMKCGNQYTMNLTTGALETSTAFDDFLAWYNTLPDTDPADGTIWKKGWSVIA